MTKYDLKLDEKRRITLPEPVANGLGKELWLSPDTVTAVIYSKTVSFSDVVRSAQLLLEMLKHEEEMLKKEQRNER